MRIYMYYLFSQNNKFVKNFSNTTFVKILITHSILLSLFDVRVSLKYIIFSVN